MNLPPTTPAVDKDDDDPCLICFESLRDDGTNHYNVVGTCVPCGHCFHMVCYEQWKRTKRRRYQGVTCPTCKQNVKEFHRICYQLDDSLKLLRKTFGLLEMKVEKQHPQQQLSPRQEQRQQQIVASQEQIQLLLRQKQQHPPVLQQQQLQVNRRTPHKGEMTSISSCDQLNDTDYRSDQHSMECDSIVIVPHQESNWQRPPLVSLNQDMLDPLQITNRRNILPFVTDIPVPVLDTIDSSSTRIVPNHINHETITKQIDDLLCYDIQNECNKILYNSVGGVVSSRRSSSCSSSNNTTSSGTASHCSHFLMNRTMHHRSSV
jgi:Ring finger domain